MHDAKDIVTALGAPDPLQTFQITDDEYQRVREAVIEEGFETWDAYAPVLVAAIDEGYLDRHLQVLGKYLRDRWMHLRENGTAPIAVPPRVMAVTKSQADPVDVQHLDPMDKLADAASGFTPATVEDLREMVKTNYRHFPYAGISPIRKHADGETAGAGQFRVHGYIFSKADLMNRHFVFNVGKKLAIFRVMKVDKVHARCQVVVAVSGVNAGDVYGFELKTQRGWFNVPEAPGWNI